MIDAQEYQTILENWAHRVEECRRLQAEAGECHGFTSVEYRRAMALTYGYRAAIQAAKAVLDD